MVWHRLVFAAASNETVGYKELAEPMGFLAQGMGAYLDPLQQYCIDRGFPDLTVLVVSATTGKPSPGHGTEDAVPGKQQEVFGFDWMRTPAPAPEDFQPFLERKTKPQ